MKAIVCTAFGDEDVMEITEVPAPEPKPNEVVIDVCAAGVNRADLMQRRGLYPPPEGVTSILGLEASGTIVALGTEVSCFKTGDHVMDLLFDLRDRHGATLLLITHNPDLSRRCARRIELVDGRILGDA